MLYYYNVTVKDRADNENTTSDRNITLDSTSPSLNYSVDTLPNGTAINQDFIYINMTVNDSNYANITFNIYNLTQKVDNFTYTNHTYNHTFTLVDLDNLYYYSVTVLDRAGNSNTTEPRYLIIDNSTPHLSFTFGTPVNDSYKNQDYVFVNISVIEKNIYNISYYLFNSTLDMVQNITYGPDNKTHNFTGLDNN
jgi:hypothetical protein